MKTVNNTLLILIVILTCSCRENNAQKKIIRKEYTYNSDSIYYNIDVKWDENGNKELFLVTRTITVKDSNFGGYNNHENWKRAWKFMKKKYPETQCPDFTYNFYILENGKFNEFASAIFDGRDITYPILRQGEFSNINSNKIKSRYRNVETSTFLRIIEINDDNLDIKSINIVYENKKWDVISKEIMRHTNKLEYCIDTTENDFSLKKMHFYYIFDYPQSDFNCR